MFDPGDLLVFQLESGFGVMRLLARSDSAGKEDAHWHLRVYEELFLDTEAAEKAAGEVENLSVSIPHTVLTQRAFLSTPVAKLLNLPLTEEEREIISAWETTQEPPVSDRSIRLLFGYR